MGNRGSGPRGPYDYGRDNRYGPGDDRGGGSGFGMGGH